MIINNLNFYSIGLGKVKLRELSITTGTSDIPLPIPDK